MTNTRARATIICLLISIIAGISNGHTLPDDAPVESPQERYRAKIEEMRKARIENYESEIKTAATYLKKTYGKIPKPGEYTGIHRENISLIQRYHKMRRELPLLSKGDVSSITVSFGFESPAVYDVGRLSKEFNRFRDYAFVVEEVLSEEECRVSCTRHDRHGSQEKPLTEDPPEHIRDFIITGLETKNLIIGERLPRRMLDQAYHVIGVRDNAIFILHPIILSDDD